MNPKPYNSFIPICRNTLIKRKEGDKRKDLDLILRHATKQPQISRPLAKNGSGGFTWFTRLLCIDHIRRGLVYSGGVKIY